MERLRTFTLAEREQQPSTDKDFGAGNGIIKAQHVTGVVFTGTLEEEQEKDGGVLLRDRSLLLTGTLEEALEQLKEHFIDYKIS